MNSKRSYLLPAFAKEPCFKASLFLLAMPLVIYHSMAAKDFWAILFISCLALFAPMLWGACAFYLSFKTIVYIRKKREQPKICI